MKRNAIIEDMLCVAAAILIAFWAIALVLGDGSVGIYRLLGYE